MIVLLKQVNYFPFFLLGDFFGEIFFTIGAFFTMDLGGLGGSLWTAASSFTSKFAFFLLCSSFYNSFSILLASFRYSYVILVSSNALV